MMATTACLLLALSGVNAYADSGYTAIGHRTDPDPSTQTTTAATQGGYINATGRDGDTTTQSSTAATTDGGGAAGNGNILTAIGAFLSSLLG